MGTVLPGAKKPWYQVPCPPLPLSPHKHSLSHLLAPRHSQLDKNMSSYHCIEHQHTNKQETLVNHTTLYYQWHVQQAPWKGQRSRCIGGGGDRGGPREGAGLTDTWHCQTLVSSTLGSKICALTPTWTAATAPVGNSPALMGKRLAAMGKVLVAMGSE